jgi:hypothetical protein
MLFDPVASQEEVIAADNLLTSLPREMLWMFVISVLDVRNNKLTVLPTELSRMVSDFYRFGALSVTPVKRESYTQTTTAHHHQFAMRWEPTARFGTRKHEGRFHSRPHVP